MNATSFPDLPALAQHLRNELKTKKSVLLYAYNGTGKTRLSGVFRDLGKRSDKRDTLYFNAYTEDLFSWDNDLANDRERVLRINKNSRFFDGLDELEMDVKIGKLLERYADFNFYIDYEEWEITFFRERESSGDPIPIKVSRGEENIFVWCFFLAVVQLVLDGAEAYQWVRYIYIDDPISSLDDNNAVMVAHHLAQMLQGAREPLRVVVSSHHVLFFDVVCREMKKPRKYFLTRDAPAGGFTVHDPDSTPFLHHLSSLVELHEAQQSGALYTHHFNVLRRVMEQTACFLGYARWDDCIQAEAGDPNGTVYKRMIDLMSHGDYSLYEPRQMMPENKEHFRRMLRQFIDRHPFRRTLFPEEAK